MGAVAAVARAPAGRAGAAKSAARRVVNWRLFIKGIWGVRWILRVVRREKGGFGRYESHMIN